MNSQGRVLYKLKTPFSAHAVVSVLFLSSILVLALWNFSINPVAFGFFASVSFVFLGPLLSSKELLVCEDRLIISGRLFFFLFRTNQVIYFSGIQKMEVQGFRFNPLNLIENVPRSNQRRGLVILTDKEDENPILLNYGSMEQLHELKMFIEQRIR